MRTPAVLALAIAVAVAPEAHGTDLGVDVGAVVWDGVITDRSAAAEAAGARWVRINFRLDDFAGHDAAFLAAYDEVVDAYVARGIQVVGLINDESVATTAPLDSDAFRLAYTASALAIIKHFNDRVRVYEIMNEPNDFAGGVSARMSPEGFARLLHLVHNAVIDHSDPCVKKVTLLSGPLLSFDGMSADEYLADTFQAGVDILGWTAPPVAGIGYHIYVAQDAADATELAASRTLENLQAIRAVIDDYWGAGSPLQIWVSELGWRADVVGEAAQADRLEAAFTAMQESGLVALALYFQIGDFPDNVWGLYVGGDPAMPRMARDRMAELASAYRPEYAAHVLSIESGTQDRTKVTVLEITMQNRGSRTWTRGDRVRLGAGPGCDESQAANGVHWVVGDGYANSLTDARVELPHDVAPDETVTFELILSGAPGTYLFAARMVREEIGWFGSTALATVEIAPQPQVTPAEPGGGDDGCGCRVGEIRSAPPWLALLITAIAIVTGRRLRI